MKVEFDNNLIEFTVQYGKAKKVSIHIDSLGLITVKAPNETSVEIIINAVKQHGTWIIEQRDTITKAREIPEPRVYKEEGKFLYLGKEYFLHELIETTELSEEELEKSLKKFYFSSCKKIVEERINKYQKQLKVKPRAIEVVESRNKWGTCSSDKKLTFNYRLVMVPVEVIDYVIIHELCHLIHMNHDRSFWRRVGSIIPDYKEKQKQLAIFNTRM